MIFLNCQKLSKSIQSLSLLESVGQYVLNVHMHKCHYNLLRKLECIQVHDLLQDKEQITVKW